MGRKVIITDPAVEDLGAIVSHIARDNPRAAARLGNDLLDQALLLGTFPLRGTVYGPDPAIRKLGHRGYKIFYHIPPDTAAIEGPHFWHAARREPDLAS